MSTRYFLVAALPVVALAVGCTSTEAPYDYVHPDDLYHEYAVTYDVEQGVTRWSAGYRNGGPHGAVLRLSPGNLVTANDQLLECEPDDVEMGIHDGGPAGSRRVGYWYGLQRVTVFEMRVASGRVLRNSAVLEPTSLPDDMPDTVSRSKGLVVPLRLDRATPRGGSESITIRTVATDCPVEIHVPLDTQNRCFAVSSYHLQRLPNGPCHVFATWSDERAVAQMTSRSGGAIRSYYQSEKETIQLVP